MPQSHSAVYIHLVFSTKNRIPCFHDPHLSAELHTQLASITKNLDCPPILVNGVDDHIHLLARFGRSIAQCDWVKELKRVSNLWLQEKDPAAFRDFHWQSGYGAFSVDGSNLESIKHYIATHS